MGTNASVLQWPCPFCRHLNPTDRKQCIRCSKEREANSILPQHSVVRNLKACSPENTRIQSSNKMPISDEFAWRCDNCTQLNPIHTLRCSGCAQEVDHDPVILQSYNVGSPVQATWLCEQCQACNPVNIKTCARCRSGRRLSGNTPNKFIRDSSTGDRPESTENSEVWECGACTFSLNNSLSDNCEICGALRADRRTSQTNAKPNGHVNGLENNGIPHDQIKNTSEQLGLRDVRGDSGKYIAEMMWRCSKCTLENVFTLKSCKSCGSFRKPADPIFRRSAASDQVEGNGTPDDRWNCQRCTYLNNATAHVCYMCEAKKTITLPTEDDIVTKLQMKTPASSDCNKTDRNSFDLALKHPVQETGSRLTCPRCTVYNDSDSSQCKTCEQDLRSLPGASLSNSISMPPPTLERQKTMCTKDIRQLGEEEGLAHWQAIVNRCQNARVEFVDDTFPPVPASLFYDRNDPKGKSIQWKRPRELQSNSHGERNVPWTVFRTPNPTDIVQGVLGNCWFLSAMAVLTEKPEIIKKILLTREICPEGVYELRLCVDGKWQNVVIDDLLPCDGRGNLIYSQARQKQLWVPLIEKALAKVYKSYQSLTAGRCIEGLACLTGAPCESISLQGDGVDEDFLWAQMLSARDSSFLMGAACGAGSMKVDDAEWNRMGLRSRHAYSVLDVQNVEGNRLVRLRNPWGTYSWKGAWSDTSTDWKHVPGRLRDKLMPHGAREGFFWMSLRDFLKYFDSLDMCKYRPEWMEFRASGIIPANSRSNHIQVFNMEVFEDTEVELGLFQESLRASKRNKRSLIDLFVVVLTKVQEDGTVGQVVWSSKRQIRSFVGCSLVLKKGVYTVVCLGFSHWALENSPGVNFALSLHSARVVQVDSMFCKPTILADTIIQLALKMGEKHEGRELMNIYYFTRGVGFVIVVENLRSDRAIHVKCDCEKSFNVVSTRRALQCADVVPPRHRQVLLLLTQLEASEGYSLSHRLLHRPAGIGSDLGGWGQGQHDPSLTPDVYGLHVPRQL